MFTFTDFLVVTVVTLTVALVLAIRAMRRERASKNALYQHVKLPPAAQTVSLPRCETVEYKLEQALRREQRAEAEILRLTAEASSWRQAHDELKREFLRQFTSGLQAVDMLVALEIENGRLVACLIEERQAKELAMLKLQRFQQGHPCHDN